MRFLTDPPAVRRLAQASQRLGSDPLLIQAAGGNSSIKEQDCLWVKASGLWLRDALQRPMFVPVSLSRVRALVAAGAADPVGPALLHAQTAAGLRPSIETTLHALMPHRVVLHVHSVDAIAWAVQPGAQTALAALLDGIRWGWVDYHRPGLPLTRAVAQRLAQPPMDASSAQPPEDGLPVPPPVDGLPAQRSVDAPPSIDVLLLGNHGLVVGGASVLHAEQRLAEVASRLRRPVRAAPAADGAGLALDAAATGWRLPGNARGHAVATDPVNLERAVRGVLYPDHVVFLGHQMSVAPAALARGGPALSDWLRAQRRSAGPAPLIAVPGRGVLLRDDLSEAACEMLTCLADVLQRLPPSGAPVYLPDEEAQALAHWEAEQFRQAQAR
ncbi:class II aldolase/adducin family protein [Verminephrobacter eiseniae]|uniref:Class II aldolase/adducin family protein n=1 Tax=Verminephrobacter eiseniae (strain EF01-2) TaxID=391735 RepID=A1WJH5_VEREI|nr:class II aldolase/adducin family protein [Verminephrobacter eiseniae]ABM57782.1 class II aldolase/adducin family protein [Verminephrobacter eiseniae EF01-2]MCW5283394.1 class II aldolase [Verminephrobacter eiseniae]MCW5301103.1 class II aldolase [Verminephrobacter eiseniae]MCW8191091.1 class II aldolase [Verminephrobacter eiseniae]